MKSWLLETVTARAQVNVYFLKFLRQNSHWHLTAIFAVVLVLQQVFLACRLAVSPPQEPSWPGTMILLMTVGAMMPVSLAFSYKMACRRGSEATLAHLIELTPIAPQTVLRGFWLSWGYAFGVLALVAAPGIVAMLVLYPAYRLDYVGLLWCGMLGAPGVVLLLNSCGLRFEQIAIVWLLAELWTFLAINPFQATLSWHALAATAVLLVLVAGNAGELFRRHMVRACGAEQGRLRLIWLGWFGIWLWLQCGADGGRAWRPTWSSAVLLAVAAGTLSRGFEALGGIEIHLRETLRHRSRGRRLLGLLLGGGGSWQWPGTILLVTGCAYALLAENAFFGLLALFVLCFTLWQNNLILLFGIRCDETRYQRIAWSGALAGALAVPIVLILTAQPLASWQTEAAAALTAFALLSALPQWLAMRADWRSLTDGGRDE